MQQVSLDKLSCPNCGKNNACKNQPEGEFNCWCQQIELTDENRAKLKGLGLSAECLCQHCLTLLSK